LRKGVRKGKVAGKKRDDQKRRSPGINQKTARNILLKLQGKKDNREEGGQDLAEVTLATDRSPEKPKDPKKGFLKAEHGTRQPPHPLKPPPGFSPWADRPERQKKKNY